MTDSWIRPSWPAPPKVESLITTRLGGYSQAPFQANNLALHVGDDPQIVWRNRARLSEYLGGQKPFWIEQVHGADVTIPQALDCTLPKADACYTRETGRICCVLTADCLPVLICNLAGTEVAAVHAGWRGLAAGVLANAVDSFQSPPGQLLVYLGPAISVEHFEVGGDVLQAFEQAARIRAYKKPVNDCFHVRRKVQGKYFADLYALARLELGACGVSQIFGGNDCTYRDPERFYSYRRDGITGRMASLIWLKP